MHGAKPSLPLPSAEGKPIPSELRREEAELRHQVGLEDDNTAVQRTHIDDEYGHAGEQDPKILITTSRDPSSRLVQFAKELKLVFPNSIRINRGGQVGRSHNCASHNANSATAATQPRAAAAAPPVPCFSGRPRAHLPHTHTHTHTHTPAGRV